MKVTIEGAEGFRLSVWKGENDSYFFSVRLSFDHEQVVTEYIDKDKLVQDVWRIVGIDPRGSVWALSIVEMCG